MQSNLRSVAVYELLNTLPPGVGLTFKEIETSVGAPPYSLRRHFTRCIQFNCMVDISPRRRNNKRYRLAPVAKETFRAAWGPERVSRAAVKAAAEKAAAEKAAALLSTAEFMEVLPNIISGLQEFQGKVLGRENFSSDVAATFDTISRIFEGYASWLRGSPLYGNLESRSALFALEDEDALES